MEEKNSLLKWAATYGLIMGIYWAVKFVFLVLGITRAPFGLVYLLLTVAVPFIAYYFTKKYRDCGLGGEISFYHAWRFGIMLYTFAALIAAVAHFVFFRYISPDFFSQVYAQAIQAMQESQMDPAMVESMKKLPIPSPIQFTVQNIFNNIFLGIIFSVPVAWLVSRHNSTAA